MDRLRDPQKSMNKINKTTQDQSKYNPDGIK